MSRASNTANLGAKLQNTTGNELSGGGNIRATTFQGSGRLLTDLFTLTGGAIVIPVGSTRTYKTLSTAFNSISSFLLESKNSSCTFVLDPETIVEENSLVLNHPSGEFISVSGTFQEGFVSTGTSPVTQVVATTGLPLSATFTFDATVTDPQIGDYVNIWYVSGARAMQNVSVGAPQANGQPRLYGGYDEALNTNLPSNNLLTSGAYVVYSRQYDSSAGSSLSGYYQSLSGIITYRSAYEAPYFILTLGSLAAPDGTTSITGFTATNRIFMDVGTVEAWKGNRIVGATGATDHTLTFSDARATNTYLNVGDCILVLNQTVFVKQVNANNTCVVTGQIRFPTQTGYTTTYSSLPATQQANGFYYLVHSRLDYYLGSHRVANRSGNSVTIEMAQTVCGGLSAPRANAETLFAPPRFGVRAIGSNLTALTLNDANHKANNRVLKSKLVLEGNPGISIYGNKMFFSSLAFNLSGTFNSRLANQLWGIALGTNQGLGLSPVNAAANVSMAHTTINNMGLSGRFQANYSVRLFNSSTLNGSWTTYNSQTNAATESNPNFTIPVPIYSDKSTITLSYVVFNGGLHGAQLFQSNLTAAYYFVKNIHAYPMYFSYSNVTINRGVINNWGYYSDFSISSLVGAASLVDYDYYTRGPYSEFSTIGFTGLLFIPGTHCLEPGLTSVSNPTFNVISCMYWDCCQNIYTTQWHQNIFSSNAKIQFCYFVLGYKNSQGGGIYPSSNTTLTITDVTVVRGQDYGLYISSSIVNGTLGGTRNTSFLFQGAAPILAASNSSFLIQGPSFLNYVTNAINYSGTTINGRIESATFIGTPGTATYYTGVTPNAAAWAAGNVYLSVV